MAQYDSNPIAKKFFTKLERIPSKIQNCAESIEIYQCICGKIACQSINDKECLTLLEHIRTDHENRFNESVRNGFGCRKRKEYLSWDDYFMSVAFLSAMRSKDPSTQVGACIVNEDKKIVGIGYNGFPNGCHDDELPWARESVSGNILDTKYPVPIAFVMQRSSGDNGSLFKGLYGTGHSSSLCLCSIYVALFPCNECAKLIIQSGIKEIVYHSNKYQNDWKFIASRQMLDMANINHRIYTLEAKEITINFAAIEGSVLNNV